MHTKVILLQLLAAWGLSFATTPTLHCQSFTFSNLAGGRGFGSADGTNANARFYGPAGIALSSEGDIYVTDSYNQTIRKITFVGEDRVVTTLAGLAGRSGYADGTNGYARFNVPTSVAVDGAGSPYVTDRDNGAIRRLTQVGTDWIVTTIPDSTNRFAEPFSVALDGGTNVYVACRGTHTIKRLSPVGTNWIVTTVAGLSGVAGSADGTNSNARFFWPLGLAVDSAGNVYVADTSNHTIRKITAVGTNWVVSTLTGLAGRSGSADGTNSDARFSYPVAIAVSSAGNLYVSDHDNSTIRQITPVATNWVVTTVGGLAGAAGYADGTGSDSRFNYPGSLAVDSAGNLYVADYGNNAIRLGRIGFSLEGFIADGKFVLSWPSLATNFLLETSPTISSTAWDTLTNGVAIAGRNFVFTNDSHAAAAFYRLRKH